jgi:hypothetical protein
LKWKNGRSPKPVPGKVAAGSNTVARAVTATNKTASPKTSTIAQTYSNAVGSTRANVAAVLKAQNNSGPMVVGKTNAPPPEPNFPAPPVQVAAVEPPPPVFSPVAAPVATPAGPFPKLKLQGIFYRLNGATALINNETVQVGSDVEGAKVVSISRMEVKVDFHGQVKALGLP